MTYSTLPDETERRLPAFSLMQAVKRRFFAMRNGDLAAQMAAGGLQYKMNFGLNLPQIAEIASQLAEGTLDGVDHKPSQQEIDHTARMLWANATTRESLLLAPMLFDITLITAGQACDMLAACPTTEVADVLCLKLLRNHPKASSIAAATYNAPEAGAMQRYGAMRLIINLLCLGRADLELAREISTTEAARSEPLTRRLSRQIADEITAWE